MGSYNEFLDNEKLEQERNNFLKWKNSVCCEGNPKKGDNEWNIIMDGPSDSPYMGGKFRIKIVFQKDFPKSKPSFTFETPICHINIYKKHICLDSLDNYNENSSIIGVLGQIFMMLTCPNENSAYTEYSGLYKTDYSAYLSKAREMTREHAKL